jgi:hypothetical protein
VSATISIRMLLFASPLNTPQPKAPSEPPPCNIKTFSILLLLLFYGDDKEDAYLTIITKNGLKSAWISFLNY